MNDHSADDCPSCADASRRRFLKQMAAGAAGVTLMGALNSCTPDDPEMLVGTLQELEKEGPLNPKFNGSRILVTYREEKIVIFSMVCRHKKCTIKWKASKDRFDCPCHDGKYDREGNVIAGPPPGPLKRYKHEIRGQEIWVLNEFLT